MHKFSESLAKSHAQADAPWWELVYRAAFPGFAGMISVRNDGWAQRGGIDRVISLESGKTISVDEKIREKDWPDILWEFWSVKPTKRYSDGSHNGSIGWACKAQACDFIAYAFVPSQTCYLLPALQLRRAWAAHGQKWIELGKANENGFSIREAQNDGYVTVSVAVPIRESLDAIRDAMVIGW